MDKELFKRQLDEGFYDKKSEDEIQKLMGMEPDGLTVMQVFQAKDHKKRRPVVPALTIDKELSWAKLVAAGKDMVVSEAERYSRKGWLAYFWMEAVGRAGQPGRFQGKSDQQFADKYNAQAVDAQGRLKQLYKKLFPNGDVPSEFNTLDTRFRERDDEFRIILVELLKMGFRGVPLNARPLGRDGQPSNLISYCSFNKISMDVEIGWRGEHRPWAKIVEHDGTKRQVDVAVRANETNTSAKWHPYSIDEYKNCLWFRGNQVDNCKYSVISVARSFKSASTFPLLSDLDQNCKTRKQVRLSDNTTREMLVTTTWVYLFIAKGLVFDTNAVQAFYGQIHPFPEKGVQRIALDDFYSWYEVERVHHGDTDQQGFTGFVRKVDFPCPLLERKLKYGGALQQLEAAHLSVPYRSVPFTAKWTDTGTADAEGILGDLPNQKLRVLSLV